MSSWTHKYVTTTGGGIHDGSNEANAWTLVEAMLNAAIIDANDSTVVWIKNDGVYNFDASLNVAGTGSIIRNEHIYFIGYHISVDETNIISDMDYGQLYYGGSMDPAASNAWVDFDDQDGPHRILTLDNKDNIHFKNIYFHNKSAGTSAGIRFKNTPVNISFVNCKCSDVDNWILGASDGMAFIDCNFNNSRSEPTLDCTTAYATSIIKCVFEYGGSNSAIKPGSYTRTIGSLFKNSLRAVTLNDNLGCVFKNNVFYNQTETGIKLTGTSSISGYNNIFVPAAQADWAVYIDDLTDGGSVYDFDYNCAYSIGNGVLANPYAHPGPTNLLISGQHNIEVDPLFINAANGDFRPRNFRVLTGGKPTLHAGVVAMGAYQPPKKTIFAKL